MKSAIVEDDVSPIGGRGEFADIEEVHHRAIVLIILLRDGWDVSSQRSDGNPIGRTHGSRQILMIVLRLRQSALYVS